MDVTSQNFSNLLPELKLAISQAEFIAFDLELSGLSTGERSLESMPFDTPKQFYEKVYQGALDFLPLQVGLCIFQYDSKESRYFYQAYNFYIFPFSKLRGYPSTSFQSRCSSIAFLSSCDFDFNKTFKHGIPFLDQLQEDKLRTAIEERHQRMKKDCDKDTTEIPIPDYLKTQVQDNIQRIRDFVEDASKTTEDCLILDKCNAFMRRLLYQEVLKELGESAHLELCDESNFAMKVMKGGHDELRKQRETEKKEKEWKDFNEAVGFSHLIKALSESGKLIVGHNCYIDVCHLVNRFRYPLPPDYDDFKEIVHHTFPRIVDTKFMANMRELKDLIPSSYLASLLDTVSKAPFEMPKCEGNVKGKSYDKSMEKFHEGGYDALITGQSFLSMCQYLAKEAGKSFEGLSTISDVLENIENRLYLMRIQDAPHMRLGGLDSKLQRNHVFHLKFPKSWRHTEIYDLFKPFGPVFLSFVNDTSAFVALHRKDQAKLVLKTLVSCDMYTITPFSVFEKNSKRVGKSLPLAAPASPSLDVLRKRKLNEGSEISDSLNKKHCRIEQPTTYSKRSIDPIPEEVEAENPSVKNTTPEPIGNDMKISKEFPESDVWG